MTSQRAANHSHDVRELVRAADPLLLARQDAGCVDQRHVVQQRHVELRALEFGEEAVAKHLEAAEGHVGRDGEGVAWRLLVLRPVHHRDEAVRRRLRADVLPREVATEQVADERGLPDRVLADEQDHRLGVEIAVVEDGRVEVAELVRLPGGTMRQHERRWRIGNKPQQDKSMICAQRMTMAWRLDGRRLSRQQWRSRSNLNPRRIAHLLHRLNLLLVELLEAIGPES